jgi:hypothetical protein
MTIVEAIAVRNRLGRIAGDINQPESTRERAAFSAEIIAKKIADALRKRERRIAA